MEGKKSIADAVEEAVKSDLRIHDAIRMGITNNRRLAREIQKEVSSLSGRNTSIGTIAVALQRLGGRIKREADARYSGIFGRSRLQLRDDISIVYIRGLVEPLQTEGKKTSNFYVNIQGIGTTTILVDDELLDEIRYKKENLIKRISNLSAIIITSPKEIVETPGVIAHLMMALGGSRINVVEVTSSYDNTFLIVEKKDSLKAVDIVRSLINKSRK
ncbi:MAG: hypothetical protein V1744_05230 [Candidatus Altiarchaeota archaeon]